LVLAVLFFGYNLITARNITDVNALLADYKVSLGATRAELAQVKTEIEGLRRTTDLDARFERLEIWQRAVTRSLTVDDTGIATFEAKRITILDGERRARGGFSSDSGSVTMSLSAPHGAPGATIVVDRDGNATMNLYGTREGVAERFEVIPSSPWFARRIRANGVGRDVVFTQ
jgi:hypothetical protein